jgi:transaldolase
MKQKLQQKIFFAKEIYKTLRNYGQGPKVLIKVQASQEGLKILNHQTPLQ